MLEIQSFWGQPEEGSVWQTLLSEVKWLGGVEMYLQNAMRRVSILHLTPG